MRLRLTGKIFLVIVLSLSNVFCDDEVVAEDETINDAIDQHSSLYMLATKYINAPVMAKKVPFTVIYTIYNIGNIKLQAIKLTDTSFAKDKFIFHKGNIVASWDMILPGESVSFATVLEAKPHVKAHNVTAAVVKYSVESSDQEMVMRTSGHDRLILMDTSTYYRRYSSHAFQWIVLAVLVVILLAGPYIGLKNLNQKFNLKPKTL